MHPVLHPCCMQVWLALAAFMQGPFLCVHASGCSNWNSTVLHAYGESSERLATSRNTKDKITYNQPNRPNPQTPQTKHKALPKGQPEFHGVV